MWRQRIVNLIDDLEAKTKEQVAYVQGIAPKPPQAVETGSAESSTAGSTQRGKALWDKAKAVTKFTNLIPAQLGTTKSKRLQEVTLNSTSLKP